MFRPIKNLLTYIQKNASGTSLFGGTTDAASTKLINDSESETIAEATEIIETGEIEKVAQAAEMKTAGKLAINQAAPASTSVKSFIAIDLDDIETQIKSSVMLRKPINNFNSDRLNDQLLDDHNGDSKNSQMDPTNVDDICSVSGSEHGAAVDEIELIATEDEEEEAPFTDLTHDFDAFPSDDIIVLDETELNNSFNSDGISQDPLAIDDFVGASCSTAHPIDEQNNTSSDILWINIDDIKTCPIAPHLKDDTCSEATPPITPTAMAEKQEPNAELTATTTLNKSINEDEENPEELRSEGSDSGMGSETSTLQSTLNSVIDTSQCNGTPTATPTQTPTHKLHNLPTINTDMQNAAAVTLTCPTPIKNLKRSNLKRRLEDTEDDSPIDSHNAIENVAAVNVISCAAQKKQKRSINFDNVQVFYFPRQQGFGCVPSAGGCTLGMGSHHVGFKTLTLAEHAAEIRRAHRQQLQEVSQRGVPGSSSEESEESEEDYLSEGSSDADESSGFLQPVSPKQRRAMLKAAGVRKIDASEKAECRDIRNSREVCGCTCRDFCDPETCACSQAGIKCQVDRAMFPCGCSRDACGNSVGRIEFNPSRVRTHFIHTIMRLEMESRHQQKPHHVSGLGYVGPGTCASAASTLNQISSNFYNMQPSQSNYSSGYASPAYPPIEQATSTGYYQQQQHYTGDPLQAPSASVINTAAQLQSPYPIETCLDANIFTAAGVNATPSYGELMPSYGSLGTTTAATSVYHAATLNYRTGTNDITPATKVSALSYASFNHAASSNYLPLNSNNSTTNNNMVNTLSSCAVPSAPPYGAATTTTASSTINYDDCAALETPTAATTTTASISNHDSVSSFINLNSPISSSSRISAINNLLQHNRNTTAALVAITQTSDSCASSASLKSTVVDYSSINTPPIDAFVSKTYLTFDEITAPLNPTPIVTVLEVEEEQANKCNNKINNDVNKEELPSHLIPETLSVAAIKDIIVGQGVSATIISN